MTAAVCAAVLLAVSAGSALLFAHTLTVCDRRDRERRGLS